MIYGNGSLCICCTLSYEVENLMHLMKLCDSSYSIPIIHTVYCVTENVSALSFLFLLSYFIFDILSYIIFSSPFQLKHLYVCKFFSGYKL